MPNSHTRSKAEVGAAPLRPVTHGTVFSFTRPRLPFLSVLALKVRVLFWTLAAGDTKDDIG